MKIITAAVIKGGTGKTTTAAALAQAAAITGKKVLAIDLDPQANLSLALAADPGLPGSYHLLNGHPADQLIQQTPQGIDCIAASADLATVKTSPGSAKRLAQALEPVKRNYHLIIIDTPPTAGELQTNAMYASTGLIIPLETDSNSLQGLYQITDIAHHVQQKNPALRILGIVLTKYDNRPKINRYLRDVLEEKGEEVGAPLLSEIRAGVSIREAQAMQESLYEYAPKSKPAQDYLKLYKKIMEV